MNRATVQEIDVDIQKLSLDEQLWLMEKLAQHIRSTAGIAAEQLDGDVQQSTESHEQESAIFYLKPDSPLHEDMQQIREHKAQGKLKFHSYKEVFDE